MGEHGAQDAPCHLVEARGRYAAGGDRGLERRAEEGRLVERISAVLVEAGIGSGLGAVGRAPVGHHIALRAEIAAQHFGEQPAALAGVDAVHLVVGAHHRAGIGALDGDLEREEVRHARGVGRDARVVIVAAGLEIVQGVMLDRRDDRIGLDAGDLRADHRAGEKRVLAAIFEIAAIPRVANEVHAAGQHDVEAGGAGFGADHPASGKTHRRVPARRGGEAGGEGGALALVLRPALGGDADAGVRLPLRRDAEARDAGDEPRRALAAAFGHGEVLGREIGREIAEDQLQFLVLGHLRKEQGDAAIRREGCVHPGPAGTGGGARGGRRGRGAGGQSEDRDGGGRSGEGLHCLSPRSLFFCTGLGLQRPHPIW